MATAIQFLRNPVIPKRKSTIVISGYDESLVLYCLDRVLATVERDLRKAFLKNSTLMKGIQVVRKSFSHLSLIDLSQRPSPLVSHRILIVDDVNRSWDLLAKYASNPTPSSTLILLSKSKADETKVRWIPSTEAVLYIDCGKVTEKGIRQLLEAENLSESLIETMVERCGVDIDEILRVLDNYFILQGEDIKNAEIIVPKLDEWKIIRLLELTPNILLGNQGLVLSRVTERVKQITLLSLFLSQKMKLIDIYRRLSMNMDIVTNLIGLAKTRSSDKWFKVYLELIGLKKYVSQPGLFSYIEALVVG